jgi:hypothetical protein
MKVYEVFILLTIIITLILAKKNYVPDQDSDPEIEENETYGTGGQNEFYETCG